MQPADRMERIPSYLFAEIEKKIEKMKKDGVDVISLGIGDPDISTPPEILKRAKKEIEKSDNHRYPSSQGTSELRKAVANFYSRRFNVALDKEDNICILIGSKEGIGHISMAFTNPGDFNLVPDPSYPVYSSGTFLAGGEVYSVPLLEKNQFLPDLSKIPENVAEKGKILFLNYPNNPTGAVSNPDFFSRVVSFAKKYDILVVHDAAYTEIAYDGYNPISFLQTPGAIDVGVEFGSVSKSLNMTGWRVGWVVGNKKAVKTLTELKSNLDSGVFTPIQYAAETGLNKYHELTEKMSEIYRKRRNLVVDTFKDLGWEIDYPKATIYIWVKVPEGFTSAEFSERVLDKTGVIITPGSGYGKSGEGFFRISLTVHDARLNQAMERFKNSEIF